MICVRVIPSSLLESFVMFLVTAACAGYVQPVCALPLERFETPLRIKCEEGERFCSGVVRVPDALGRHTGVGVMKSLSGDVSVEVSRSPKGRVAVEAEDASDLSLTFSWDGDSNPEQLSGAGLNCADLMQQGASAFIVSGVQVHSECGEVITATECPTVSVEARVYNPEDPTGQKFLVSLSRRTISEPSDVVIPFSNFIGQGPRGKASFTCVGAVTITFTFRGFKELEFSAGPIYSNGLEGLTPLPSPTMAPSETATETPTIAPTLTAVATVTVAPISTVNPTAADTTTPEGVQGTIAAATTESAVSTAVGTPVVAAVLAELPADSEGGDASAKEQAPKAPQVPASAGEEFAGEAVYGELVPE
jgi:hypothetical protein